MSFMDSVMLTRDPDFIGRVTVAAVRVAQAVVEESTTGMSASRATARARLAQGVLATPTALTERFTWIVVANPTVSTAGASGQAAVSDTDIEYVITTVWDSVAGAEGA